MTDLENALRWRLNRLRCMTPQEILHRSWRATIAALARAWPGRGAVPAPDLNQAALSWLPERVDVATRSYLESAARIAAGRLNILALADFDYGMPPRWNRHPQTGFEWPLRRGLDPALRNERQGDIKYLWEPNRHLHLVTLAQAYRLTGDPAHAKVLMRLLDAWFEQCPYPRGPNWASAMEAALRLINWSLCWQLLGGTSSPLFAQADFAAWRGRWLESVYRHMDFVRCNLSLHSSANNHLIGELAGLFIAGRTWPCWPAARRWAAVAQRRLAQECLKQNAADGVNLEQATSYHVFVLEYLMLAGLCARAGPADFPPVYWRRLEAMCEYLHLLGALGGAMPAIGDSDDAAVVRLCPLPEFDARRTLLASAALLFGRGDFAAAAGDLDDQTAWLFDPSCRPRFAALRAGCSAVPRRTDFSAGGYRALGMRPPGRLRVLFDMGPMGYTRIAAHGHADALAILLWLDGQPLLIDAGTFCYNDQPDWRAYFRGTSAHNTVLVDGVDQSVSGGTFMWLRKATVTRLDNPAAAQAETARAEHDGYRRLADPVRHERLLELAQAPSRLVVTDTLHCGGMHQIEICWHFAENCEAVVDGSAMQVRCPAGTLRVAMREGEGAWHLYRGQEQPPWGWLSPRFGVKIPIITAVWRARIQATSRFQTSFEILEMPLEPEKDAPP